MNNFYASVECMLNPALRGRPVAVCGETEDRHGIVLAKNYEAKAYGSVKRIGGNTRYETSVLIAKEFFPHARQAALAYAQNFPDGLSGGALAYAMKAPLVLTASGKESAAAAYAKEQGITVPEAVSDRYDGTIIRFQLKDGQVGVQIVVDKENIEGYLEAAKKWLEPCCKNFQDVTDANPDICEIHYFTKPTTWEE